MTQELQTKDSPGRKLLDNIYKTDTGARLKQCIQCGTCSASCPYSEDMDKSVRYLIAALRAGDLEELLKSRTLWMCISCNTCKVRCPKNIQLPDILISALREKMVLDGQNIPEELQKALENTSRYGNPLGNSPKKRAQWTAQLDFKVPELTSSNKSTDILWFVECYPSYYPRNIEVTKQLAWIFNKLSFNYAILGNDEKCAGDCQRLAGEVGLFEMLAEENIKLFNKYSFNEILVTDPHAYNGIKNEYPRFGGEYAVTHYTQFFARHIEKLKPHFKNKLNYTVTFHDPCYLGRRNGEYDAPREILKAILGTKFIEMPYSKELSLCCGGGGGAMWLDGFIQEYSKDRVSDRRVKQAVETGADILAICCPYELSRFDDSIKVTGNEDKIKVKDITELIYEAMV